jgi:hypothetical protein
MWFAWVCYFRVLLDPAFAARVWAVRDGSPSEPVAEPAPAPAPAPAALRAAPEPAIDLGPRLAEARAEGARQGRGDGALLLLGVLQAEGRIVDFLQQDITSFPDGDVATAARVIHEGCRRALRERIVIEPIRPESEGVTLTIDKGFDPHALKLTGTVSDGGQSFRGTLRHKGWRAAQLSLPEPTKGHDPRVLCPAEVEL